MSQKGDKIGPYEDLIDQEDGRLAVQLSGKRHLLAGHTPDFHIVPTNTKLPFTFMSPQTFERIADHLSNNGFEEDKISSLREAYKAADAERSLPKVEFDDAGQVQSITRRVGYEMSARVQVLTNSSAYDQGINSYSGGRNDCTRTSLSALAAIKMVAEASEIVSPEQQPALERFAEKLVSNKSPAPAPAGTSGDRFKL